jgi:serine phosphatase RsbU (regulator of sigma subunit)
MVQAVLEAVNVFQEEEAPADDMTLLALRFRGNPFSYDI